MNLTVAYQKDPSNFMLREFINNEVKNSEISYDSLNQNEGQIDQNEESRYDLFLTDFPEDQRKILPAKMVSNPSSHHLNLETFENMNFDDIKNLIFKVKEETTIRANLITIENITKYGFELAKTFTLDREKFIEQLWQKIYENLATYDLKILFQSINNKDAKELTYKTCNNAKITNSSNEETLLFNDLKSEFGQSFFLVNYEEQNQELTFTSTLGPSKIIIMARVSQFTVLQKSALKGMFNSLAYFVKV